MTEQFSITNFYVTSIEYLNEANESTNRLIEPFALLRTQENWLCPAPPKPLPI